MTDFGTLRDAVPGSWLTVFSFHRGLDGCPLSYDSHANDSASQRQGVHEQ